MKRIAKERGKHCYGWVIFAIVLVILLFFLILVLPPFPSFYNVGRIPLNGVILTTEEERLLPYEYVSSEEIIKNIEDATKNKNIKAIIFEINSPGGSAVASSEIAQAIKKAKKEKLTVAVIREQGTSGAYWIASSCDYVLAHPLSITGSIGVTASYLEISGLLERFNITYVNLTTGKYKETMSPFRELTNEEREIILKKLESIHETFIMEVTKNRGLTEKQVEELANGMFYLGTEAKELGLVDAIGSREEAIDYIEKKLNIKANLKEYKKPKSFFEKLAEVHSQANFWLGRGIGASLVDKNLISSMEIVT
ncbi:MAG: signal peptide peptidase SppA [Candidatus Pacearchaeota archaeon]|nr:signal peptide peptidase SppA [Candidatus Pacearchaeota archaeon]